MRQLKHKFISPCSLSLCEELNIDHCLTFWTQSFDFSGYNLVNSMPITDRLVMLSMVGYPAFMSVDNMDHA